jgi:hypothetical protein
MNFLGDDLLINIAKRVATDDAPSFCNFMRTNKRHCYICRTTEVLRVLNIRCVKLLFELDLTYQTLSFSWRLWHAGHPMFCLIRCTQQLLHDQPKLHVVKHLLEKAIGAGSNSARYFEVLLRATSYPLPDRRQLFKDFNTLLKTRKLNQYRHDVLGIGTPYRYHCMWHRRWFPLYMVHPVYCNNWYNCPGDGRRGGYRGFLPAEDEEYDHNNFCISCRIDSEIRWFVDAFSFDNNA